MDNFNNGNLYIEDDWQDISTPVVKTQESDPEHQSEEIIIKEKNKKPSKHPVLTLQLTLAVCFLLFLFILKFLGTPAFDSILSWYKEETSKSVIFDGNFESLDFSSLFATADEG